MAVFKKTTKTKLSLQFINFSSKLNSVFLPPVIYILAFSLLRKGNAVSTKFIYFTSTKVNGGGR